MSKLMLQMKLMLTSHVEAKMIAVSVMLTRVGIVGIFSVAPLPTILVVFSTPARITVDFKPNHFWSWGNIAGSTITGRQTTAAHIALLVLMVVLEHFLNFQSHGIIAGNVGPSAVRNAHLS